MKKYLFLMLMAILIAVGCSSEGKADVPSPFDYIGGQDNFHLYRYIDTQNGKIVYITDGHYGRGVAVTDIKEDK